MTTNNDYTAGERAAALSYVKARRQLIRSGVTFLALALMSTAVWALGDREGFWPAWSYIGLGFAFAMQTLHVFTQKRPVSEREITRAIDRRD